MKISDSFFFDRAMMRIQNNNANLAKVSEQVSTGLFANRPSDAPERIERIQSAESVEARQEMFSRAINAADRRLEAQNSALDGVITVLRRIEELTVQGANNTSGSKIEAQEIREYIGELLELANSRDESGNHIFGGSATRTPPFERVFDATGNSQVVYNGDSTPVFFRVGDSRMVNVTFPGPVAFGLVNDERPPLAQVSAFGEFTQDQLNVPLIPPVVTNATVNGSDATFTDIKDSISEGDTFTFTFNGEDYTATVGPIQASRTDVDIITAVNAALAAAVPAGGGDPLGEDKPTASFTGDNLQIDNLQIEGVGLTAAAFQDRDSQSPLLLNFSAPGRVPAVDDELSISNPTPRGIVDAINNADPDLGVRANLVQTGRDPTGQPLLRIEVKGTAAGASEAFSLSIDQSMLVSLTEENRKKLFGDDNEPAVGRLDRDLQLALDARSTGEKIDFFSTLDNVVRYLETDFDDADRSGNIEFLRGEGIQQLQSLRNSVVLAQGSVGVTQTILGRQSDFLNEERLRTSELLSELRDLDFSQALTELRKQEVILEAALGTVVRVSRLSLFNLID